MSEMVERITAAIADNFFRSDDPHAAARAVLQAMREPGNTWDGLARRIMMWLDMDERHTPRTLLTHLLRSGVTPPQWLLDEPEMKNVDHVMSKGTRCVLIYRAMLENALEDPRHG